MYHHMRKSPENDAMPYARESPDKEKTNHKYKDKIPQKYPWGPIHGDLSAKGWGRSGQVQL